MALPYRPCVAALITRKADSCGSGCQPVTEVLLAHKPRKRHAWGLPQGGIEDGESPEQAAKREVQEELGVEITVHGLSEETDRYKWPWYFIQKMVPVYGKRFRGQQRQYVFASLKSGQVIKPDDDEIDDFAWVSEGEIDQFIESPVYLETIKKVLAASN